MQEDQESSPPPSDSQPAEPQKMSLFQWNEMFSWNWIGWWVALLAGLWGGMLGIEAYTLAYFSIVFAGLLMIVRWGHACSIHLPRRERRVTAFCVGLLAVGAMEAADDAERQHAKQAQQEAQLDKIPELQASVTRLQSQLEKSDNQLNSLLSKTAFRPALLDREATWLRDAGGLKLSRKAP